MVQECLELFMHICMRICLNKVACGQAFQVSKSSFHSDINRQWSRASHAVAPHVMVQCVPAMQPALFLSVAIKLCLLGPTLCSTHEQRIFFRKLKERVSTRATAFILGDRHGPQMCTCGCAMHRPRAALLRKHR